ncbi:PIN domain-containing protein [Aquihabitans sp. McL0605]|uniref:PIN domain-containing protein n=1 Tax=Aquihabitans sp. McL0605 TaxID=3415671 RepID=UPI003CF8D1EE
MGAPTPRPVVVDCGALIAFERGDRSIRALLREADHLIIPAGVVAQVWRGGARQARIARLLQAQNATIEPLDAVTARVIGVLCAHTGTSDVVDASVALAGQLHDAVVVTSDPDALRALAPGLDLQVC